MLNSNSLLEFFNRKQGGTLAVVDGGWGDSGKGKLVDYFAGDVGMVARGTGGANAGHTIVIHGRAFVFHLVPAGILRDQDGVVNIIGSGVAIDPAVLSQELAELESEGKSYKNLRISKNAKLVLPQHILLDRLREKNAGGNKIGTTGRGIGPVYEDHVARLGLTMNDLLNPKIFRQKLVRNLAAKKAALMQFSARDIRAVLSSDAFRNGAYYHTDDILNVDEIVKGYLFWSERFRKSISDTDTLIQEEQKKRKLRILLEGAQGVLLSLDYGSYPYVTSSEPTIAGLARGVGLKEGDVGYTVNVVKAFYMTRVGEGPFPTEFGGSRGREWCKELHTKEVELKQYPDADVNHQDEFIQGIGIRIRGGEYGATTGRPRRTGWFDLPLLRFSLPHASNNLVLTKLDVLDECKTIMIATGYIYRGPDYWIGQKKICSGMKLDVAVMDSEVLSHCEPVYVEFPGWLEPISHIRSAKNVPENLMRIVRFVEKEAGVNVVMLSVGPDREQLISL